MAPFTRTNVVHWYRGSSTEPHVLVWGPTNIQTKIFHIERPILSKLTAWLRFIWDKYCMQDTEAPDKSDTRQWITVAYEHACLSYLIQNVYTCSRPFSLLVAFFVTSATWKLTHSGLVRRIFKHIAKILGSMSIRYRPDPKVSDQYLIGVDPRVFAI